MEGVTGRSEGQEEVKKSSGQQGSLTFCLRRGLCGWYRFSTLYEKCRINKVWIDLIHRWPIYNVWAKSKCLYLKNDHDRPLFSVCVFKIFQATIFYLFFPCRVNESLLSLFLFASHTLLSFTSNHIFFNRCFYYCSFIVTKTNEPPQFAC